MLKQNTAKIGYERASADLKKSEEQLELIRIEGMRIEDDKEKLKSTMDNITKALLKSEDESKKFDDEINRHQTELDSVKNNWKT